MVNDTASIWSQRVAIEAAAGTAAGAAERVITLIR
jgi:hypothetical protein